MGKLRGFAISPSPRQIAYICLAIRLGETLTVALNVTPYQRLLEGNVCRNYYGQHDPGAIDRAGNVPEDRCKVGAVQAEVSHINGLANFFLLVPSVLAALRYLAPGRLAHKSKILLLNALGGLLMNLQFSASLYFYNVFDPRWIWINGIFSFIGGGDLVFYSLIASLIAESIEGDELSTFYIYSSALAIITRVLGSASSLAMMQTSLWLPVSLSLVTKALSIPTIVVILYSTPPVTSDHEHFASANDIGPVTPDEDAAGRDGAAAFVPGGVNDYQSHKSVLEKQLTTWQLLAEIRGIASHHRHELTVFALHEMGNSLKVIQPFWLSRRFHWTLRETGWVQLGIMLLTSAIVFAMPRLSHCLQARAHPGSDGQRRDLNLAKICLLFGALGTLLLGSSWYRTSCVISLAVLAGGVAFRDAYMAYLTTKMRRDEIAAVFVVLEMASLAAFSLGAWLLGEMYAFYLGRDDSWGTSLPIWVCAIPFLVAWYLLLR